MKRLTALICLLLALALPGIDAVTSAAAQEEEVKRPRRFFGSYIQLEPILVPFQGRRGIRFDAITVRLWIGNNATADAACWTAPFVHQEILFQLYDSGLTLADFSEDNLPKLSGRLMKIATDMTAEGVYEKVEVMPGGEQVGEDSRQLSALCA